VFKKEVEIGSILEFLPTMSPLKRTFSFVEQKDQYFKKEERT
jgi:hypothetical protein